MVADSLGVDILEVIEASKTKWSFQAHYPGIGVGGHCIPVDPYYVLELAKTKGIHMPVVSESLEQNEKMPNVFFNKLFDVYKVPMKVTVYGLAYKKNVKDKRESPSLAFCALLKEKGILFDVYDPFYTKEEVTKMGFTQAKKQFADIFVIATDHDALSKDKSLFIGKHTVVIDGRNYFQKTVGARVIGLGRQFA
jgi:nucleotide sugar dehydrogenase